MSDRRLSRFIQIVLAVLMLPAFTRISLREYEGDQRTVRYRNSYPNTMSDNGIRINPPPGYSIVGDKVMKDSEYRQSYGQTQLNHGCDGNCIVVNSEFAENGTHWMPLRAGETAAPSAPKERREINLSAGLAYESKSGIEVKPNLDMSRELRERMSRDRAIGAGAATAAEQIKYTAERNKRVREQSRQLREEYKDRQEDNSRFAEGIREATEDYQREVEKRVREQALATFIAGLFNDTSIDSELAREQHAASQIAADPLATRSYEYNEVAQQNVEKEFSNAVAERNYSQIAKIAESIFYDENRSSIPPEVSQYFTSEGIMLPEKIDPSLGPSPFSETQPKTEAKSSDGQLVRRVMNEYQSYFAETNGLTDSSISDDQKANFIVGGAIARIADEELAAGNDVGYGLLSLAQAAIDLNHGFIIGAKDSIVQTIMLVPDIASGVQKLYVNLRDNPQQTYDSMMNIAQNLPAIKDAFVIAATEKWDIIKSGDAYGIGKMAGSLTTDIAIGIATAGTTRGAMAAVRGSEALAAASKAASAMQKVASTLPSTLGRAPVIITESVEQISQMSPNLRTTLLKEAVLNPGKALSATRTHRALLKSTSKSLSSSASEITEMALQSRSKGASEGLRSAVRSLENPEHAVDYLNDVADAKSYLKTYEKMSRAIDGRATVKKSFVEARGIPERYVEKSGNVRVRTKADVFIEHDGMKFGRSRVFNGGPEGSRGMSTGIGETTEEALRVANAEVMSYDPDVKIIFDTRNTTVKGLLDISDPNDLLHKSFDYNIDREVLKSFRDPNILGHVMREKGIKGVILPSNAAKGGKVLHVLLKD